MSTRILALQLMAFQGCLGAFDTIYHHELTEALPQRATARRELSIHALRALIYGVLFIGLSAWVWQGAWTWVLLALFALEIGLTLWDFVIEDRTRLLPATERVTHTVLAINGGAFICLLALAAPEWLRAETGFSYAPLGALSACLALCGVGVMASGVRDAIAANKAAPDAGAGVANFESPAQTVLVTGGTGFVGRALIPALLASGHRVIVLTRDPRKAAMDFNGAVRAVGSLSELPRNERIDVMINLAGARILGWRWTAKRKAELRRSRVALTGTLVDWIAAADHKPRLMISASAIGYYGIQDPDGAPLDEAGPPQDIFMSQLCQEWEIAAGRAREFGVPVACTRFGVVYGKGGGALPMMLLPIRLGIGGRMGSGRQRMPWIHLQDLLRAMAHVWSQPDANGAWNFTAPHCPTQAGFAHTAAKEAQRPAFMPTPAWPVKLLLGEQAGLLLEGQNVAPVRLQATGFSFRYPTLGSALHDLM
jgi:uncharacterized protein (TIGR01777 family)